MKIGAIPNYDFHNKFLRDRKASEIYLGINTNINCLDDWCPNDDYEIFKHKIGLYLGKIIFEENKHGNLAPKYIPSDIKNIEQQIKQINPLWLDEVNNDYTPPLIQYDEINGGYTKFFHNNVKVRCKNSNKNITLSKAQIISYFTELHRLNATFIKSYIDSINKHDGIRANYLNGELYEKLLKKGILKKDMFEWYSDGNWASSNKANLITLDYLKKTNQYNFNIAFFNELFYAYLVWSLKEFTILYYQGYIAERKNILFNLSAYIDDTKFVKDDYLAYKIAYFITHTYKDILTPNLVEEIRFCGNAYHIFEYGGFFYTNPINYFSNEAGEFYDKKIGSTDFSSPNQINSIDFLNQDSMLESKSPNTINDDAIESIQNIDDNFAKQPPIYAPSPLGNYYFELDDNLGTFTEFYTRIYPSIKNPPKGWTKEMMSKLELTLE